MITTRNVYRWFLAIAFAAFAVPALAAPVKKYTLDVSPTIVSSPLQHVTVLINNVSTGGNSNINSMKVYLPEGYTLKVEPLPSTYRVTHDWTSIGSISATDGGNVIGLSAMSPLRPTNKFNLKFWVNVPACGTQSNWATAATGPTAWNGTDFNGDTFTLVPGNNVTTTVGGSPSMAFDPTNPTSTLKNTDVVLKVNLFDGCSAPANGTVVLGSDPLAFTPTTSQATVDGVATFTVKFANLGTTTLSATASGFGLAPTKKLTVFDGELECAEAPFDALKLPADEETLGQFESSTGGATLPGETGFLAGIRGLGDPLKDPCAVEINASATNNINGETTLTDPVGNKVPAGFYSFAWDVNQEDNPVVGIISTMKSEWGDATTGLPVRKTLICTVTPKCESAPYTDTAQTIVNSPDWKPAVACLSTMVTHSSIPDGELGCVAMEKWVAVPEFIDVLIDDVMTTVSNPQYCSALTKPSKPTTWPEGITWTARCLQPTAIMIMGVDPIWGR